MSKCDTCFNTRTIISENGTHKACCLSEEQAIDCMMNKKDSYIKNPMIKEEIENVKQ